MGSRLVGLQRPARFIPGGTSRPAVHIHFKLRLYAGSTTSYEFTSQFFFNDPPTESVYTQSPYSSRAIATRAMRTTDHNT
ncbi:MAG TPA: hypothetical protein VN876_08820 [Gemmatimonadaceae bacterium]|nr:hypothetical protein [Gemmatimonadaceae bacterium]